MRWFRKNNDELIHLRMENARLLGIIETLAAKSPDPDARTTDLRPRRTINDYEHIVPRAGIMSPSGARKMISDDMRKRAREDREKDNGSDKTVSD